MASRRRKPARRVGGPARKGRERNPRVGVKPKEYAFHCNIRQPAMLVDEVQKVYLTGLFTQKELADYYGLTVATVQKIVNLTREEWER